MQVDFDRLSQYHESGKLRRGTHPDRNLFVWCYSQATVYNDDWDDLTLLCRGLVTDNEGTVLSRPFPKFFNWGQERAPGPEITEKPFWAFDKIDGSLIIVGLDSDGEAVVSTKGSFTTWHSEKAREMLNGWTPVPGSTAIFEFIHPNNRIVLDYGDRESLVLLGAVANETGEDHFTPENYADESGWFGDLCPPQQIRLQSILQTVQDPENGPNKKGFVLLWPNSSGPSDRVKIKFSQYVHLHRVLSRMNNVAVWEALMTGTFDALLELCPDEIYDKVRACADELNARHSELVENAIGVANLARINYETRKDQAQYVLNEQVRAIPSLVFKVLDGKTVEQVFQAAWPLVKPFLDQSWTFLR